VEPEEVRHSASDPLLWLLDHRCDPQAQAPLIPGIPQHAGDSIIIADQSDQVCFDVIPPQGLESHLPRSLHNLARLARLRLQRRQEEETVTILNEIGHALAAIPDRDTLMHAVLFQARRVVRADAGSLYLVSEGQRLEFGAAQNDTIDFESVAAPLPIDDSSLAGYVANRGVVQLIHDAYNLSPGAPYTFNTEFDRLSGYCTRTMLSVPMRDRQGRVIAVVSLINRKPTVGEPIKDFDEVERFTDRDVALVRSIAAQAAVALENHRLYEDIRQLFDGFVNAAVGGIEARDPATGGHSHRVARLTVALAQAAHRDTSPPYRDIRFTPEALKELHYAALLHDFGKVGVREEVLLKAEKLYPSEMETIEGRFRQFAAQIIAEHRQAPDREELRGRLDHIKSGLGLVRILNRPGSWMDQQSESRLRQIAEEWTLADTGEPLLQPFEVARLSMARGSLSQDERQEINAHVEHTYRFLKRIPWTPGLQRVPELALAHHERLDGSGYPFGLRAERIPYGSRLMAICDVFDAVTAGDRPYRSAMTLEKGLWILQQDAKAGKLDKDAVKLFVERRIWESVTADDEDPV